MDDRFSMRSRTDFMSCNTIRVVPRALKHMMSESAYSESTLSESARTIMLTILARHFLVGAPYLTSGEVKKIAEQGQSWWTRGELGASHPLSASPVVIKRDRHSECRDGEREEHVEGVNQRRNPHLACLLMMLYCILREARAHHRNPAVTAAPFSCESETNGVANKTRAEHSKEGRSSTSELKSIERMTVDTTALS